MRILLAATLAALLLSAVPAGAAEYRTSFEARDSVDFSVREGTVNDRCTSWTKLEGTVTTTITAPRMGKLVIFDPPGPVGVLLNHSLLKANVTTKLTANGKRHAAFRCGCGPDSELGLCPPEQPDTTIGGDCKRGRRGVGSLSLGLGKGKFFALAGAPVSSILDSCVLSGRELVPSDIGLPADLRLTAADLRRIRRLKVDAHTEIRETYQHHGSQSGCPRGTADATETVCGVLTIELTVYRIA